MAAINGVPDRVKVGGRCTPEVLEPLLNGRCLLVCDCEGDEVEVLQPEKVRGLVRCDVLVELHDFQNPSITPLLRARFSPTHCITLIDAVARDPEALDSVDFLNREEKRLALAEFRVPSTQWGMMTATAAARAGDASAERRLSVSSAGIGERSRLQQRPLISACILARNEEGRIEGALECLQGWTDQIIVIDNESEDDTAGIARRFTDCVISAPRATNFDALRNRAIEHATGDWIFYLDADERVPPRLGEVLRRLVRERGGEYEAFHIPFRNHFCGKWIQHSGWWPGYKAPPLLKKGHFRYGERVHAGAEVLGRSCFLPADDLDLTIAHYTYDDLHHYLSKINRYTDAEAANLRVDRGLHSWQAQLAHFVHDWQLYYERGEGYRDGMHGFVLAFMAGMYRFLCRAKLWLLRTQVSELTGPEALPASTREMLEFMEHVAREGAEPWLGTGVFPVAPILGRTVGRVPADWYVPWGAPDQSRSKGSPAGTSGITACIVACNEEQRIEGALRSLVGWTDQIIVVDNESTDGTVEISRRYADRILTAPKASNFEAARASVADAIHEAAFAAGDWLFYLDADERVSPGLGPALRALVQEHGEEFDGICLPFRNHYYGKWMQGPMWWPGYKAPQLLKKGTFRYGDLIHAGIWVGGRLFYFPGDDPALAVNHYAYEDIGAHLTKLNRYTDDEAELRDPVGEDHSWQSQLADFAQEWYLYYDRGQAYRDGMHGFVNSLLLAFYRLATRAKIWHRRYQRGAAADSEPVPGSVHEMLELMTHVTRVVSGAPASRLPAPSPSRSPAADSGGIPAQHEAILVQCAGGDHVPLIELTRERHEAYARAHGMDYLCRIGPQQTERNPCWDKIPLLLEVLRHGRHREIFWMDADTMIVDMERDLREALPEGYWLGMVHHGDPPYYNDGVMYIRNTLECSALFEQVWRTPPPHPAWLDNEVLVWVLRQNPGRWRGVCVVGDEWNSTALENESRRPVVRAWHGYGRPPERRVAMEVCLQRVLLREQQARQRGAPARSPQAGTRNGRQPPPVRPSANLVPIDPPVTVDLGSALGRALRVQWEGDQFVCSSLALVNREFCLGLLAAGDVELCLKEGGGSWRTLSEAADPRWRALSERSCAELSGAPDVTVRHYFPPNWEPVETGKLIVIQPWEYSLLPCRSWVQGASENADEVWVHSRFVRDAYVRSGVPAEKVRLVPLGFNPAVLKPDGPRYSLSTQKSFRFLFVGGTLQRKGADLVLAAYQQAFTRRDDVCLVVKDMGTRTFYQGQTLGEAFRRAADSPGGPEVIYLDGDLSEAELASLYRACACLVLPYRGEGFALPPLEAMACGLPAIVTAGGPTDDYLDDTMALRVPHRRQSLRGLQIGQEASEWEPWCFEPDLGALIDALRWARDHPEETRQRGEAARAHAHAGWTWDRAVWGVRQRLLAVCTPAPMREIIAAKPWGAPGGRPSQKGSGRKGGSKGRNSATRPAPGPAAASAEVSLCMIARDEEARIGHSLNSIASYVDEMIVVDTGSTDRTREVARECGARVFDFPWTDSFAEARNQSLAQARGEWVFWMDADDVITPECGRKLCELVRQCPRKDAAYQMLVRIPPGPRQFSEAIVDHVKLFPNRADLRFEHRIHEQILPALRRAGLEIRFSDVYVTHEHYDRSEEGQAKKRRRDFELLEMDLRENPDHPFVLFNLGMTHLFATRECEVAAHYLQRCLDRSHPTDSIVRKAYALLATARLGQREIDAAIAANEAGRRCYPEDAELLFQAGQLYQEVGRFGEARGALERLMAGEDAPHYRSVDVGLRTYRGGHELALLCGRTGDERQCEGLLREIAAAFPEYLPARVDWVRSLGALGQEDVARRVLREIPPAPGIEAELRELRMRLGCSPSAAPGAGAAG